jgi:hypothetical protein
MTRAPTKKPVIPPKTGSRMNQNRKPKKQTARPIRARMIPTSTSIASLHPQRKSPAGPDLCLRQSGNAKERCRGATSLSLALYVS